LTSEFRLFNLSESNPFPAFPRWQHFIWHILFSQLFITKSTIMGNLLYVIAVILVIAWAIGFLGYHAGGIIHILLVIAIVAVLLKIIRRSSD
jgi:hypothetical protein